MTGPSLEYLVPVIIWYVHICMQPLMKFFCLDDVASRQTKSKQKLGMLGFMSKARKDALKVRHRKVLIYKASVAELCFINGEGVFQP